MDNAATLAFFQNFYTEASLYVVAEPAATASPTPAAAEMPGGAAGAAGSTPATQSVPVDATPQPPKSEPPPLPPLPPAVVPVAPLPAPTVAAAPDSRAPSSRTTATARNRPGRFSPGRFSPGRRDAPAGPTASGSGRAALAAGAGAAHAHAVAGGARAVFHAGQQCQWPGYSGARVGRPVPKAAAQRVSQQPAQGPAPDCGGCGVGERGARNLPGGPVQPAPAPGGPAVSGVRQKPARRGRVHHPALRTRAALRRHGLPRSQRNRNARIRCRS